MVISGVSPSSLVVLVGRLPTMIDSMLALAEQGQGLTLRFPRPDSPVLSGKIHHLLP